MIANQIKKALENASWIREMFEQGALLKKEFGEDCVYDFSLGKPIFDPPLEVQNAFDQVLREKEKQKHSYMSNAGYEFAKKHMAQQLEKEYQTAFEKEHIILTCGAGGGLNVVLKTLLNADDEVIIIKPFFVEYQFYVANHQGKVVLVESNADFSLNLENIEKAMSKKTKALLLNFPNNPTGAVYTQEELQKLAALLNQYSAKGQLIYLISDEPYRHLCYDQIKLANVFQAFDQAILVSSFSKDLSLAGERIGYIALSPKLNDLNDLIAGCIFVNRTLGFVNAPAFMQRVISKIVCFDGLKKHYEELRNFFYAILTDVGFTMQKPAGGMFFFPRVPIDDIEFCKKAMQHNILMVPGSGFGRKNHVRISFSVEKEMIERAHQPLKKFMQSI